jgi:hypothetical protein
LVCFIKKNLAALLSHSKQHFSRDGREKGGKTGQVFEAENKAGWNSKDSFGFCRKKDSFGPLSISDEM